MDSHMEKFVTVSTGLVRQFMKGFNAIPGMMFGLTESGKILKFRYNGSNIIESPDKFKKKIKEIDVELEKHEEYLHVMMFIVEGRYKHEKESFLNLCFFSPYAEYRVLGKVKEKSKHLEYVISEQGEFKNLKFKEDQDPVDFRGIMLEVFNEKIRRRLGR